MGIKSILLVLLGGICLLFGLIGLFVPVLPTTPFVLLAAGCFGGSSPKMYLWLENSKQFGPFIRNYRTKCGVENTVIIKALIFLWVMLGISIFFMDSLLMRCLLVFIGVAVTVHLVMLRKKK